MKKRSVDTLLFLWILTSGFFPVVSFAKLPNSELVWARAMTPDISPESCPKESGRGDFSLGRIEQFPDLATLIVADALSFVKESESLKQNLSGNSSKIILSALAQKLKSRIYQVAIPGGRGSQGVVGSVRKKPKVCPPGTVGIRIRKLSHIIGKIREATPEHTEAHAQENSALIQELKKRGIQDAGEIIDDFSRGILKSAGKSSFWRSDKSALASLEKNLTCYLLDHFPSPFSNAGTDVESFLKFKDAYLLVSPLFKSDPEEFLKAAVKNKNESFLKLLINDMKTTGQPLVPVEALGNEFASALKNRDEASAQLLIKRSVEGEIIPELLEYAVRHGNAGMVEALQSEDPTFFEKNKNSQTTLLYRAAADGNEKQVDAILRSSDIKLQRLEKELQLLQNKLVSKKYFWISKKDPKLLERIKVIKREMDDTRSISTARLESAYLQSLLKEQPIAEALLFKKNPEIANKSLYTVASNWGAERSGSEERLPVPQPAVKMESPQVEAHIKQNVEVMNLPLYERIGKKLTSAPYYNPQERSTRQSVRPNEVLLNYLSDIKNSDLSSPDGIRHLESIQFLLNNGASLTAAHVQQILSNDGDLGEKNLEKIYRLKDKVRSGIFSNAVREFLDGDNSTAEILIRLIHSIDPVEGIENLLSDLKREFPKADYTNKIAQILGHGSLGGASNGASSSGEKASQDLGVAPIQKKFLDAMTQSEKQKDTIRSQQLKVLYQLRSKAINPDAITKKDLLAKDQNGKTLLHLAAEMEEPSAIDLMLDLYRQNGVSVDLKDSHGRTPLNISELNQSREIYKKIAQVQEEEGDVANLTKDLEVGQKMAEGIDLDAFMRPLRDKVLQTMRNHPFLSSALKSSAKPIWNLKSSAFEKSANKKASTEDEIVEQFQKDSYRDASPIWIVGLTGEPEKVGDLFKKFKNESQCTSNSGWQDMCYTLFVEDLIKKIAGKIRGSFVDFSGSTVEFKTLDQARNLALYYLHLTTQPVWGPFMGTVWEGRVSNPKRTMGAHGKELVSPIGMSATIDLNKGEVKGFMIPRANELQDPSKVRVIPAVVEYVTHCQTAKSCEQVQYEITPLPFADAKKLKNYFGPQPVDFKD